eukprot:1191681-Prorocentrum_minimum.AAC.3
MSADERAQEVKNEGNQHFKNGNYQMAISLYSRAIGMTPEAAPLYGYVFADSTYYSRRRVY